MSKTCQKVLQDLYDSVKTQGEQIAIVDYSGKRKTTWKEFIIYINSAAYYLKKEGIKKGDIVALELGRTMEHFAIRMACNVIGAIWFSVNIDYPEDRKIAIYKICKPKIIVQEKNLNEIEVDEYPCQINYEIEDHEPGIIVFTSGTTGVPKGILHDRTSYFAGSLIIKSFGFNLVGAYGIVADMMFAVSIGDMYQIYGKYTCHIVDNETRKDPVKLRKYFIDYSINTTVIFPSLLKLILPIESLSLAHIVGEKSVYDFSDVKTVVINNYACSEILTIACEYLGKDKGFARILPYCKLSLIDENGKEIKKGDTSKSGEISYTGFIAAIKYLGGEPNKTTEVILENGETMVLRTLKTGDMGRYNEDGNIEVLGRVDSMVKIRGNRVDVVEVEYNILKQENIFEVAVKCFNKGNENYLCAYYTTYDKNEINEKIIRENLKKVIPEYMIPAFFVYKEKFEKNVHGKIDREKLLKPKTRKKVYISPKDKIEKELIEIIKNIIKIKKIGMEDSLKNMGISSLSAIQIQLEIENSFGVNIIASKLMNLDIIKEIANEIKKQKNEKIIKELNIKKELINDKEQSIRKYYPIKNMAREMYKRCIDMQEYNATKGTNLTSYHFYFVIKIINSDFSELKELICKLVDTHPMLKASIELKDGKPHFVKRDDWYPCMKEIVLKKRPNEKYFKTIYRHFEIPGNELLRIETFKYRNEHYIFFVVHHLLVDGYSLMLIIRNIKNFLEKKKILNETMNYFELYEKTEKENINNSINDDYYNVLLKEGKSALFPKDDLPDEKLPIYSNIKIPVFVPNIEKICKTFKLKKSMIFFTSCIKAISQYLDLKKIIMPFIIFGRNDEDLLKTVGCFYDVIPLIYNRTDTMSFLEDVIRLEKQFNENLKHKFNYDYNFSLEGLAFYNYLADFDLKLLTKKLRLTESSYIKMLPSVNKGYANMSLSFEIIKLIGNIFIINIDYDASKYNRKTIKKIGELMKTMLINGLKEK